MGDVILISSDSGNSNSPPTKRTYLSDSDSNTNFLGLGLSQGERAWTKDKISPCNIRNVHELSGSDSSEEYNYELSPIAHSPRLMPTSDEDMDSRSPCEALGLDSVQSVGLGLGLTGNRPRPGDLISKHLPGSSPMPRPIESNLIPKQTTQILPDREYIHFQAMFNNDDDLSLECRFNNENITIPAAAADKKAIAEQKRHAAKIAREIKLTERAKRLAEQAQVKASKQALAKARQLLKPEECIKHLSAIVDNNLFEQDLCGNLHNELEAAGVTYTVKSQVVPLTVTWMRQIDSAIPEGEKVVRHEQYSLLILPCSQLMELIQRQGLCNYVQGVQAIAPENNITLIIHGTGNFFRSQKKTKDKDKSNTSQDDVIEALVEVQLFTNCDHRFVESCLELATTISQFSKAISEIPYRLEKQKKEIDKLEWFGESDSKDCVRVDKNGHGLLRLWKQQLCEFNLAGLQMAEAITSVYPSPQALFQAYDSCSSQSKRESMLQDVPIRRGVGALSSVRRIGPELSKKLHTFFTSLDGEVDLSNE